MECEMPLPLRRKMSLALQTSVVLLVVMAGPCWRTWRSPHSSRPTRSSPHRVLIVAAAKNVQCPPSWPRGSLKVNYGAKEPRNRIFNDVHKRGLSKLFLQILSEIWNQNLIGKCHYCESEFEVILRLWGRFRGQLTIMAPMTPTRQNNKLSAMRFRWRFWPGKFERS